MDIQRGDQVYYRGEVWTVIKRVLVPGASHHLFLQRIHANGKSVWVGTGAESVQRVEQVR